jgi:hypothetical protein
MDREASRPKMKPLNYVNFQVSSSILQNPSVRLRRESTTIGLMTLSLTLGLTLSVISPVIAQFRPGDPGFFGDGEESIEQEIERLNRPSNENAPLLIVDDPNSQWLKIISSTGQFTVSMPGTPSPQSPEELTTRTANLTLNGIAFQNETSWFSVAYADYPERISIEDPQAVLEPVKAAIAARFPQAVLSERSIQNGAYPGWDMRLSSDRGSVAFQLYLVDRRLYVLGAMSAIVPPEPTLAQFFESFQIRASDSR